MAHTFFGMLVYSANFLCDSHVWSESEILCVIHVPVCECGSFVINLVTLNPKKKVAH